MDVKTLMCKAHKTLKMNPSGGANNLKKLPKKLLAGLVSMLVIIVSMPLITWAADPLEWNCGPNGSDSVKAILYLEDTTVGDKTYEAGTMVISGSGAMGNWSGTSYAPWYSNRSSIETVIIENGVTTVGDTAFWDCSNLTNVKLTGCTSLELIDKSAFQSCNSLRDVDLSGCTSLKTIDEYAFYRCVGLISVDLSTCTSLKTIGESAFRDCSNLTNVKLTNCASLETISSMAFRNCSSLRDVDLSGCTNLKTIDNIAFQLCNGLTNVKLTDCTSLKTIGEGAFYNCTSLTNVKLTDCTSLETIGPNAFDSCSGLTDVDLINCTSLRTIGTFAFNKCTGLTSVTIPDEVKNIAYGVFQDCSSLTSVEIGKSVETIGTTAFSGCSNLNEINVDEENLNFSSEDGVLFNKAKNTLILFPEGKSGSYTIPYSVTNISGETFIYSKLTSVELLRSDVEVGNFAFAAPYLKNIIIPCDFDKSKFEFEIHPEYFYFKVNGDNYAIVMPLSEGEQEIITTEGTFTYTHDWGDWESVDDTSHKRTCKRDESHVEEEPHDWQETERTATQITYQCEVCGGTKSETITPVDPDNPSEKTEEISEKSAEGVLQTGESNSEMYVAFSFVLVSAAMILIVLNRKRKID